MYFRAVPESAYNSNIKKSKTDRFVSRLLFCATPVWVILAIWGYSELTPVFWGFTVMSVLMGGMLFSLSNHLYRICNDTVCFNDRNVEVRDYKGNITKTIDYEGINQFEKRQLIIGIFYISQGAMVTSDELLIMIYYGTINNYEELNVHKERRYDMYYGSMRSLENCIAMPYHEEAMELLKEKCPHKQII